MKNLVNVSLILGVISLYSQDFERCVLLSRLDSLVMNSLGVKMYSKSKETKDIYAKSIENSHNSFLKDVVIVFPNCFKSLFIIESSFYGYTSRILIDILIVEYDCVTHKSYEYLNFKWNKVVENEFKYNCSKDSMINKCFDKTISRNVNSINSEYYLTYFEGKHPNQILF